MLATNFIPKVQMKAINNALRGEEKSFFQQALNELNKVVTDMPETYEQDGKGDDAVAYLHYYAGGADWYITEKDMNPEQHQAFGLCCLEYDELGYVSIEELRNITQVEIDLHWTPKTLGEIKAERK